VTSRLDHLNAEGRARGSEARSIDSHQRSINNQHRSIMNAEQAQAEQLIRQALGIAGPFDSLSLTPEVKNLLDLGFRELTVRSGAFPENCGKESPLAVARDIIGRFQPMRQESVGLSVEKIRQTLRYPTPQALDQAFQAGQIPKAAYDLERNKFLDIAKKLQQTTPKPEAPTAPGVSTWGKLFGAGKQKPGTMGRTKATPTEAGKE
jgi:hypothetical protein